MRKAEPVQPGQIKQTPTPTKGPVDVIIQTRGESGTRHQASPDPHKPHSPKPEIQGVC